MLSLPLLLVAMLVLTTTQVAALVQLPVRGVPPSTDNSGSFFCTAFLENTPGITENINSGRRMLYITTDEPTPVPFTVQFGNLPLLGMPPVPSVTGTATAGQYTQVTAPPIVELGVGTGSIPRLVHAVQITSTGGDIQVYAVHDDERSSDGWLVLPQVVHPDVSTYRYATFSSLLDAGQLSRNTIFATTSCFTNRFTISLTIPAGYPTTRIHSGSSFFLNSLLNPGTTVSYSADTFERSSFFISGPTPDLTGWRPFADHPMGVVTGHACGRAPVGATACDHLVEQVPPTYTWGYNVFTAPQSQRFGEMYRVQSDGDGSINVTCTVQGSTTAKAVVSHTFQFSGNSISDYVYEFVTNEPEYCCIESSRPISVMQYAAGHSHDETRKTHGELGDPFMILIPPVEQYINNVTFTTDLNVNDQFNRGDYISITVPLQFFNTSMIVLDGSDLSGLTWYRIQCSNGQLCGMGTNTNVSRGFHRLAHLNPNGMFFVSIYGWGDETSWGFPGGFAMRPIGIPIFSVAVADTRVVENAGPAQVRVFRSGNTNDAVSVHLISRARTAGPNSATIPDDVAPFNITVMFPAGSTSQLVSIPIINDILIENDETFEAVLSKVAGTPDVVIGTPNVANVVIVDDDQITVQFDPVTYTVTEGEGVVAIVKIVSNRAIQGPTVLRVFHNAGSAMAGSDYVAFDDNTVQFPVGAMSVNFSVTIVNDNIFELPENFQARLALVSGNGVRLGPATIATVNINDDDALVARFEQPRYTFNENVGQQRIFVTLNRASAVNIPLRITTANGAAIAPGDYTSLGAGATITFPAGTTRMGFDITIINDNMSEQNEPFTAMLGVIAGQTPVRVITGSPNPTTLEIVDDDVQISFEQSLYTVAESGGSRIVTVVLDKPSAVPIPLQYSTVDDTATAPMDYTSATNQAITIPANTQRFNISIPINDDNVHEATERFRVMLSRVATTPSGATIVIPNPTTVEITDNDRVFIGGPNVNVTEDMGPARVCVRLMGDTQSSTRDIMVRLTPRRKEGAPREATPTVDFSGAIQTVTIMAGSNEACANIAIVDDNIQEGPEQFCVQVGIVGEAVPNSEVSGTPGCQICVTINDPQTIVARFENSLYTFREDVGQASVVVVLDRSSSRPITLQYSTNDGTAVAPGDYTPANNQRFTIPAGMARFTINIPIVNDAINEPTERFQAQIALVPSVTPSGVTIGTPNPTNIDITDNDNIVASFEMTPYIVDESVGNAVVTVVLNRPSPNPLMLQYSTVVTGGGATAQADFTAATNQPITIPANTVRFNITIPIVDDSINEPAESFNVMLARVTGTPSDVTLGNPNPTTVTINDNEGGTSVNFDTDCYFVNESAGTVTLRVRVTNPASQQFSLFITTADGSATEPMDYTRNGGSNDEVIFPARATEATFTIPIINNNIHELTEDFTVRLDPPREGTGSSVTVGTNTTVKIIDDDSVEARFEDPVYTFVENIGSGTIAVTLNRQSSVPIVLQYSTSDGTAVAPGDYTAATNQRITIPAGSRRVEFQVPIVNDNIHELTERFTATLSQVPSVTPSGVTIVQPNPTNIDITNDDNLSVQFDRTTYPVNENGGNALLRVVLDRPSSEDTIVNFVTDDITANSPSDYMRVSERVTIPAGSTGVTVPVPIVDDSINEPDETFRATLSIINEVTTPGVTIGSNNPATVTINDNEGGTSVNFDTDCYFVNESAGTVTLRVRVTNPASQQFSLFITTADGSATEPMDYTRNGGSNDEVTFPAGATEATFTIPIINNNIHELTENFTVRLDPPGEGTGSSVTVGTNTTVKIIDDDSATVQFSRLRYTVAENDSVANLEVVLSRPSAVPVTILFTTIPGTAMASDDFTPRVGQITIPAGTTTLPVPVSIVNDNVPEPTEEFQGRLILIPGTTPSGIALGQINITTVEITDSDVVTVNFASMNYIVTEGDPGGIVRVCLLKDRPTATSFPVIFTPRPGTAMPNIDYTPTPPTVFFGSTANMACADIPIIDDSVVEPNETFSVDFSAPGDVLRGSPEQAIVTILDNDGTRLSFTSNNYIVREDQGPQRVCVELSATLSVPITVRFTAGDLTPPEARNGMDYTAGTPQDVTIAAGSNMACVNYPITNDMIYLEPDERFRVMFSVPNPQQAALIDTTMSTSFVTIVDDDNNVVVDFESNPYTTGEGGNPELCLTLSVTSIARNVVVNTMPTPGTAGTGDYLASTFTRTVTFPAGSGDAETPLRQCFRGSTVDDFVHEPTENFTVNITPTTTGVTTGPNTPTTVVINDNDRVVIGGPDVEVFEDMGPARVCVRLMGDTRTSTRDIMVRLTPRVKEGAPREATITADFSGAVQTVTIMAGSNEACANIAIVDDNIQEGPEQFCVRVEIVGEVPNSEVSGTPGCQICVTINDPQSLSDLMCHIRSPLMVTPFTNSGGESASYNFRGSCEHVFVEPCDAMPDVAVVGDFLSTDLTMGRVGLRNGTRAVVLTEQLMLELRGGLTGVTQGPTTMTNLGSLPVVVTVGEGMITLTAAAVGIKITRTSSEIAIELSNSTIISQSCGLCGNKSGALVSSNGDVANIMNRTEVDAFANSHLVRPSEQVLRDDRRDCASLRNDTVIGDPLFRAAAYMPQTNSATNLCYEIHGAANQVFSLVSDSCVAVNAQYAPMNNPDNGNIIREVGIVAVDSTGACHNITVTLTNGECRARRSSNNGDRVYETSFEDTLNGVSIRQRTLNRVRVSVPNCERVPLVMWVTCENTTGQEMIRFDISRGINLRPTSHGLLGQFWNIPVTVVPYSGEQALPEDYDASMVFVVTVSPPNRPARQFIAERFSRNWDNSPGPCMYVGNSQGGPSGEVTDPNDSVIEPTYRSYRVDSLHNTRFTFNQFREGVCPGP